MAKIVSAEDIEPKDFISDQFPIIVDGSHDLDNVFAYARIYFGHSKNKTILENIDKYVITPSYYIDDNGDPVLVSFNIHLKSKEE